MQNKTRLELADYEAENLARLQKMFSRKWEFIFMQVSELSQWSSATHASWWCVVSMPLPVGVWSLNQILISFISNWNVFKN